MNAVAIPTAIERNNRIQKEADAFKVKIASIFATTKRQEMKVEGWYGRVYKVTRHTYEADINKAAAAAKEAE